MASFLAQCYRVDAQLLSEPRDLQRETGERRVFKLESTTIQSDSSESIAASKLDTERHYCIINKVQAKVMLDGFIHATDSPFMAIHLFR